MKSTDLAAFVASRVLHDLSSPLTVVMAGLDTVLDPSMDDSMRSMSGDLMNEGLKKMSAQLHVLRYVIGSQELNDNQASINELRMRFDEYAGFRDKRKVDWRFQTDLVSNRQMRLLLNMALVAIEPVGKNGTIGLGARVEGEKVFLEAVAIGQAAWRPPVVNALGGERPEEGWGGGRIQPYFVALIAEEMGFGLEAGVSAEGATLVASGPVSEF